ncbi:hypothetical protein P7H19_10580 [Paenibacillus larvae]|nr:hypothetical protein [Paenibacillus larvae]MDT2236651.1 hypothetical protein [Paenibacillus larvae]
MQARVTGKSEVANVKFLLDRLADIRPDDHLKYVNELGKKYEGVRKKSVYRDIGGKALLTEQLL